MPWPLNCAAKVMTVVVVVFLPFVLAYQTWTYYVFRRRVSRQEFQPSDQPDGPQGRHHRSAPSPDASAPPAGQES